MDGGGGRGESTLFEGFMQFFGELFNNWLWRTTKNVVYKDLTFKLNGPCTMRETGLKM